MQRTIENTVIKDRVTFVKTAEETDGALTHLRVELAPAGGAEVHYHDKFTETFVARQGTLGVKMGPEELRLEAGEEIKVPKYMLHKFYNPNDFPIEFEVKIEPGSRNFEEFLQIMYGLARDGKTNARGVPTNLLTIGVISSLGETFPPKGSGLDLLAGVFRYLGRVGEKRGWLTMLRQQYVQF